MKDEIKVNIQVPMTPAEWAELNRHLKAHNIIKGRWVAGAIRDRLAKEKKR